MTNPQNEMEYYYRYYQYHAEMCKYYYQLMFGDQEATSEYILPPNIEVKEKWKTKTSYEKTYTPIQSQPETEQPNG
ncbi:hypothetical protein GA0061096_3860 [Fictibacillus enclensis]|uniref:Uncharacterized protein n=1 Tax=Fictibacillus enclensis TaxID=1017270 RepID=A0A0V8J1H6_9BACL|nr:hypothetical protein [Fictibacillus enclensis]KSU80924.1 hypothetical protein AS030_18385 [Fictibacillus enclensis]SCC32966.1 hypothetical protein GA0061096_3860 [Fictibacillus enclensis]